MKRDGEGSMEHLLVDILLGITIQLGQKKVKFLRISCFFFRFPSVICCLQSELNFRMGSTVVYVVKEEQSWSEAAKYF